MSKFCYNFSLSKPGRVVIFNNRNFSNGIKRKGSERDVARLFNVFRDRNYEVELNLDKDSKQMRKLIKEYSERDYSNESFLICVIMSNGKDDAIYSCDNELIYLDEFVAPFKKVETLQNKPKLFFVLSCRGDMEIQSKNDSKEKLDVSCSNFNKTPLLGEDFLYCYSTRDELIYKRDMILGTIYIQTLCDCINEFDNELDAIRILTRVNNQLFENNHLVAEFTSRLRLDFYFKSFGYKKDVFYFPELVYDINYSNPGRVIIINNESFLDLPHLPERDKNGQLYKIFTELGFNITTHTNQTSDELREIIRKDFLEYDYSNESSVICFFISYGDKDTIMSINGEYISLNEFFTGLFQNPTLKDKPKISIAHGYSNLKVHNDEIQEGLKIDERNKPSELLEADFLYLKRIIDYKSYKDDSEEEFFKTLCGSILKYKNSYHLVRILEVVGKKLDNNNELECICCLNKNFYLAELKTNMI